MEEPDFPLALAATFPAPRLDDIVRYWMRESGAASDVVSVAPAEVLSESPPEAHEARPAEGLLVVPFRLADIPSDRAWVGALKQAGSRRPVIAVRVPDPAAQRSEAAARRERRMADALADEPGVDFVRAQDVLEAGVGASTAVPELDDDLIAALGTTIARRVHAARSPRRRVLAVHCDGILWGGICAEADPLALVVGDRHRAVQAFMVDLRRRGWELWLVGRGDETDARRVFRRRPDMPLAWEDFARVRISWRSSVENLETLMAERAIPAREVVFLTARPWAAAVARDHCPGVIALDLPRRRCVERFLAKVWAFDTSPLASVPLRPPPAAGQGRTSAFPRLPVDVHVAAADEFEEIARLSAEVHHFNTTGSQVDAAELAWFARQRGREVLTLRSDPDRRLVGAVRTRRLGDAIRIVDWWLRAGDLGRGLESESLRAVGRRAVAAGVGAVEVAHVPRRDNEPVRRFMESIGAEAGAGEYRVPIAAALAGAFEAGAASAAGHGEAALIARAAGPLGEPRAVLAAVLERDPRGAAAHAPTPRPPQTESEKWLAAVWSELLGVSVVRLDDDFFALGGDSLSGTRLLARIRAVLGIDVTLADLFDAPTLEAQARGLQAGHPRGMATAVGAPAGEDATPFNAI